MPKFSAKYVAPGDPAPSGWIKYNTIAVDTQDISTPSDLPFYAGVSESVVSTSYLIISDTTNAGIVGRTTGNNTGTSIANTPTFWASTAKTEESFLFLVNRLPGRVGQTLFTNGADAVSWLNSNGYWTSYNGGDLTTNTYVVDDYVEDYLE